MSDANLRKLDQSYECYSWGDWVAANLFRQGKPVYELHENGTGDVDALIAAVEQMGGKLVSDNLSNNGRDYFLGEGIVNVRGSDCGEVNISVSLADRKLRDALMLVVKKEISNTRQVGTFYVLVQTGHGYDLASAGKVEAELCRENYQLDVLTKLDHVTECLNSSTPCGRLALLDGPPGTGKSYAIRALALATEATFVLVAPSLVGSLSGPQLIPVLLDEKKKECPMVLVMEDADHALVSRDRGDLVQLSELLNMGDGLLGDLIDLRILATTNACRTDLDKAVTRPGRLCSHVEFVELNAAHARQVMKRLTGKESSAGAMTLADAYRLARGDGWVPTQSPSPRAYV